MRWSMWERECKECNTLFECFKYTQTKYCSHACRQRAYRRRKKEKLINTNCYKRIEEQTEAGLPIEEEPYFPF